MVSWKSLLPVLAGNVLMILSGAFTVWPVIYIPKILEISYDYVGLFLRTDMIAKIGGTIIFSLLAEIIGRKYSLLLMTFPVVVSIIILELFYQSVPLFCIARICSGLIVGGSFAVLPIYIAEISESNSRGGLIASIFLFYSTGEIIFPLLSDIAYEYPLFILVSLCVIPVAYFITFALVAPETPYYYLRKHRHTVAKTVLEKLRTHHTNTDIELIEMQGQATANGQNANEYDRVMVCVKGPAWVKSGIMMFGIVVSQLVISFGNQEAVIYMYRHQQYYSPIIIGNILMILSGAFTIWPVIYFPKILEIIYDYVGIFFRTEMIAKIGGAIIFPLLAEIIGRKYSLLLMTLPAVVSIIISEQFYHSVPFFYIARVCSALIVGGSFAVLPIYIAEISESNSRGRLIASIFLFFSTGEFFFPLLSIISFAYLPILVSLCAIVLAVAYFITFALVAPETPYYYLRKQRHNVAKTILEKLRTHHTNTDIEFNEMQGQVNANGQNSDEYDRVMVCVKGPAWVKSGIMMFGILVSQLVISVGNQEALIYMLRHQQNYSPIIIGAAFLLSSCACIALVDKIGRKVLLIVSYGGIAVSSAAFIILRFIPVDNAYAFILPTTIFNASHFSLLILQTILLAELFPLRIKMISSALFTALFVGSEIVTELLFYISGVSIYFPIILISVGMLPIVRCFYLETKGKSLQKIQLILNKK